MARKRKPPKAGITVHTGDSVVIPAGQIRLSLRRGDGVVTFSPQGVTDFIQMMYFRGSPETPAGLDSLLQNYLDEASSIIENNLLQQGIEFDSEAGSAALDRLAEQDDTLEIWAIRIIGAVSQLRDALSSDDTVAASWIMHRLTNCHAMLIYKRELEYLVQRGYRATGKPATTEDPM